MARKRSSKKVEAPKQRVWNGYPVYDCPHCPFDSLHKDQVDEHVYKAHVAPKPIESKPSVLLDRFGNPI
jgi:hypothetical protein